MAKIRNPAAYAAWLARKQMAEQQQQNVQMAEQAASAPPVQSQDQQLVAALMQQAALKEAMAKAVRRKDTPFGVYDELFGGATPFRGYNERTSAYKDLNLGHFGGKKPKTAKKKTKNRKKRGKSNHDRRN